MTDRELLELAAKAVGYEAVRPATFGMDCWMALIEGEWQPWNPLTEDGDVLRLAVKLCMQVECSKGYQHVSVYGRSFTISEQHDGRDPYAATRRAIVRAAAELGKSK